jgi:uncharacterized protein DUF6516
MPATTFPEYAREITEALEQVVTTGDAVLLSLQVDQRSAIRGFIAGSLQFANGATLHVREFVDVSQAESKIMYAYHYQDADHRLIFRYDNAAHRPALPSPAHKHTGSDVEVVPVPTLSEILDHILRHQGGA